jgi:RNA polymerase sigma factor (sigma-70 family)
MSAIESHELPDERLARALRAGEDAAFDELYRRYARRLSAYGARLLGDASAGEDVAQIALLRAYQALGRGTEPAQVRAWLFRIAHNAALEILSRRRDLVELKEEHHPRDDSQEAVAARGALVSALTALPDRQRSAYLLREIRGLRISEIAEQLDLTQQQVEQALFAARNRLAEELTFGHQLDCETARELHGRDPRGAVQRALKRHLRACLACRARPGRRLGLAGPLAALRDLLGWLGVGGAAAPAAKLGAVAAAAALTAGTPLLGGAVPAEPERATPLPRATGPRATPAHDAPRIAVRPAAPAPRSTVRRAEKPRAPVAPAVVPAAPAAAAEPTPVPPPAPAADQAAPPTAEAPAPPPADTPPAEETEASAPADSAPDEAFVAPVDEEPPPVEEPKADETPDPDVPPAPPVEPVDTYAEEEPATEPESPTTDTPAPETPVTEPDAPEVVTDGKGRVAPDAPAEVLPVTANE